MSEWKSVKDKPICERCGDLPAAEDDTVCENCRMVLTMLRRKMHEESADDPIGFDRSDDDIAKDEGDV